MKRRHVPNGRKVADIDDDHTRRRHRVLVLGAGMAGLSCARELVNRGYEVLVVEARSRVGGRLKCGSLELSTNAHASGSAAAAGGGYTTAGQPAEPLAAAAAAPAAAQSTSEPFDADQRQPQQHQDVDLGGALIHGVTGNPLSTVVQQIGIPVKPVAECLLLDPSGWPVDPKLDERVSATFNECLEESFQRSTTRQKQQQQQQQQPQRRQRQPEPSEQQSQPDASEQQSPQQQHDEKEHEASQEAASEPERAGSRGQQQEDKEERQQEERKPEQRRESFRHNGDERTQKLARKQPARQRQHQYPDTADSTGGVNASSSFGALFEQVCREKSVNTSSALMRWYQSNLEVSCGASFDQLGLQWNEDEPYGFDGEHVALSTSWKVVVETLAEGLDIAYDAAVQQVHVVHPGKRSSSSRPTMTPRREQGPQQRRKTTSPGRTGPPTSETACTGNSRRQPAAATTAATTAALTPTRQSRRLKGEDVNARRSSRQRKSTERYTVDHPPARKRARGKVEPDGGGASADDDDRTIVQVTLQNGTVLQADSVVCTLPLGILKLESGTAGSIRFEPPLDDAKRRAVGRLGTGLLNKCALSFPHVFWQDSDFLGLAEDRRSYLVLNASSYTGKPILTFMYGGAFAKDIEDWTDQDIVEDCLEVLRKICGQKIPLPLDYCVTRWGHEQYSRMAFTYVPPGVNGFDELQAMSRPVYDQSGTAPVLMFAGEHTTPYHPSTIHGAFLSGIREAYRLDFALEPEHNEDLDFFSEEQIYQRTFSVKRKFKVNKNVPSFFTKSPATSPAQSSVRSNRRRRGAAGVMSLRRNPKTLQAEENGNKKHSTTPESSTRRSQRSLATQKNSVLDLNNGKNGKYGLDSPEDKGDNLAKEPARDLQALEDRILSRGVESYGRDFAYIRTTTLPVHGSRRRKNRAQIRQRYHKLRNARKRQLPVVGRIPSASTLGAWEATTVFNPGTGIDANGALLPGSSAATDDKGTKTTS